MKGCRYNRVQVSLAEQNPHLCIVNLIRIHKQTYKLLALNMINQTLSNSEIEDVENTAFDSRIINMYYRNMPLTYKLLYKDYKHVRDLSKGKKFMTNGIDQKWIMKDDISYYLEAGWTFGSCRKRNRNPNTVPWNKGIKRLEKSGTFNKIAVNNGTINKFISKEDLNEYINKGYSLGLKKFND